MLCKSESRPALAGRSRSLEGWPLVQPMPRGLGQSTAKGDWEEERELINSYNDMLESELSGEVENGRLVRLMIKLGFINERAE